MTSVVSTALAPRSFSIGVERDGDAFARERLLDAAMGPGRFRKSSQKLRTGRTPALALVARDETRAETRVYVEPADVQILTE